MHDIIIKTQMHCENFFSSFRAPSPPYNETAENLTAAKKQFGKKTITDRWGLNTLRIFSIQTRIYTYERALYVCNFYCVRMNADRRAEVDLIKRFFSVSKTNNANWKFAPWYRNYDVSNLLCFQYKVNIN